MARKKITRDAWDVIALYHVVRGNGQPVITRAETAGMSNVEIKELFKSRIHVEHIVPHALTSDDHPSNLQFMTPDDHAPKTSRDVTEIAKTKRITKDHEAFRQRLLAKSGAADCVAETSSKPKAQIKSRGFQTVPADMKRDWKTGKAVKVGGD